jgi:hypothetical protein
VVTAYMMSSPPCGCSLLKCRLAQTTWQTCHDQTSLENFWAHVETEGVETSSLYWTGVTGAKKQRSIQNPPLRTTTTLGGKVKKYLRPAKKAKACQAVQEENTTNFCTFVAPFWPYRAQDVYSLMHAD